jgi:RNA polymerase sigma factor (sigma-70 family)
VAGQDASDVVVLPRVADDPVFIESLDVPGDPVTPEPVQAPKALGNDPHEFAALYMRHRWSFALHARRFLNDQRDIDEVVQEGFLKLFLAMPELDNELQALAYARRTITNLCIDRYRADQRRPRLVDLEHVTPEMLAEDDELDPLVAAEDAAFVREALAQLSPLHREALIKREIEEKPLPQIAAELDIPVEQVKHVLHRARRALRRLLVGTYVEPGVNLDLAAVLAANRARAAAAGKPIGAAVIALVLLLAGFLGLKGSQGRTTVAEPSHSGAGLELGGDPTPQHGVVGSVNTPAPPAPTTSAARSAPAEPRVQRPVRRPAHNPKTTPHPVVLTPPALPTPTGGGTTPPVVAPVADRYVVTGLGQTHSATVTDQQRSLRGNAVVSSSTLNASTGQGAYTLNQQLTFDETGDLQSVALSETVPVGPAGAVGRAFLPSSLTSTPRGDGTLLVQTAGTATSVGTVNGLSAADGAVTVSLLLDASHVSVLEEYVTLSPITLTVQPTATPAASEQPSAPMPTPDAPSSPAPDATALPVTTSGARQGSVVVQDLGAS